MKKKPEKEKQFKFEMCQSCFGVKGSLNTHQRTVHENEKTFKCEICQSCFGQKSNLNRHQRTDH